MWGLCQTPIWCTPVYNKWKAKLKTRISHLRVIKQVKHPTWENHESQKTSFIKSPVLSTKWSVNSMKWHFCRFSAPLLVILHDSQKVSCLYYGIKTEISTHTACATIGCVYGRLIEMTVPQGIMGCHCAHPQPIKRPESCHMTPHGRVIIVNNNGGWWSESVNFMQHFPLVWYQDVEVSQDFKLIIYNSLRLCAPAEP